MNRRQIKTYTSCIFLAINGCASNGPAEIHDVGDPVGLHVVDYDASRRGAYVRINENHVTVCAEPQPDIAVATAQELKATIDALSKVKASLDSKLAEQTIDLARRGQTLQILREAMYRLCELKANSSDKEAIDLYKNVIASIQAIAIAELGNSGLPDRAKTEAVDKLLRFDYDDLLKPKQ